MILGVRIYFTTVHLRPIFTCAFCQMRFNKTGLHPCHYLEKVMFYEEEGTVFFWHVKKQVICDSRGFRKGLKCIINRLLLFSKVMTTF